MWIKYNNNPQGKNVGDCVIRAIALFLNQDWDTTYIELAVKGYSMADLQSADNVWNAYLIDKGCNRHIVQSECDECITLRDFARIYSQGRYMVFVGEHVVTVIDGSYFDTWDSGDCTPIYFFTK